MKNIIRALSPARLICMGFALVIFLGSLGLSLPWSLREGVELSYVDALYTSTSAVCVTGLVTVDPGDTFTPFGQTVLALLIQIGGLGVTAVGAGIILMMGKRMDIKGRLLVREAMNLDSGKGIVVFVKSIFITTIIIEGLGALLSLPVFLQDFAPLKAVGVSLFHSVAAFNNSGFDILGGMNSLVPYQTNVLLSVTTMLLIFFGGIGFLVIREMWSKRLHWKKYSMHAKVVLTMSGVLIVAGTLLLKATENISWLGALFTSVSARTAGFASFPLGDFTSAGLLVVGALMFIGASPGSTGGGIKTSTFLVLLKGLKSAATNTSEKAFRYAIPRDAFRKAAVVTLLAAVLVFTSTYLLLVMEPGMAIRDALFEMVSAYGTVGLSTGISPGLCLGSKLLTIVVMFVGRLGPLTVVSLWYFSRGERVRYPEGNIAIG